MVYRSTHHHAVRYRTGEAVLWRNVPAIVTEGGFKCGNLTIECEGETIQFCAYDREWPEKVFA